MGLSILTVILHAARISAPDIKRTIAMALLGSIPRQKLQAL
jgi:hypothetical protein